ncbi:MAG: alpha/beta fold hydrolase [Planctomycetota bacterium]
MSTLRAWTLALCLLFAAGLASAQETYTFSGTSPSGGAFEGSLRVVPVSPTEKRIVATRVFANGTTDEVEGPAAISGSNLIVSTGLLAVGGSTNFTVQFESPTQVALRGTQWGLARGTKTTVWNSEQALAQPSTLAQLEARFAKVELNSFVGAEGKRVAYARLRADNPRGAIVFSVGRTESATKYAELIWDLRGMGYSFYLLEHRGQGRSERLLGDQRHHVERYEYWVDDLEQFLTEVVRPDNPPKLYGWGHSMGGGILARHLEVYPGTFDAAVLSAPMIGLQLTWWEKVAVRFQILIGKKKKYAKGKGDYDPSANTFATNQTTSSQARFDFKTARWNADASLWLGGPTYGWVRQANRMSGALKRHAKKITTPTLLFQAQDEAFVKLKDQEKFAKKAPQVTLEAYPGARHELLLESDAIRDQALTRALDWFAQH